MITGLSLCLLLRANSPWTLALAATLSIAEKFVFRIRGKHFFNPSNFGIVVVILITGDAWITPGQWGNDVWLVLLFAAAGGLVTRRVGRWDTTGTFLGLYALLEAFRNYWLGWTWDVYAHKIMSGSLLLFSFFMITDPRCIPDHRRARIFWAALVAVSTYVLRNRYFVPAAPFWALFFLSPLTPLFDWISPSNRFELESCRTTVLHAKPSGGCNMKCKLILLMAGLLFANMASAFCGFYVAKADTKLFNQASKVVLVRDGDRTVLTMANDFQGKAKDFAIVVPVPVVLKKEQVHVGDPKTVERLDAFSAPRLVEYFDEDQSSADIRGRASGAYVCCGRRPKRGADALGVKIEAQFTVGEYDIVILSATESNGLQTWLNQNGYKIPQAQRNCWNPTSNRTRSFS